MYPVQDFDQKSQYSSDLSSNASERNSINMEEEISEQQLVSLLYLHYASIVRIFCEYTFDVIKSTNVYFKSNAAPLPFEV